jgi:hypothetical protein
MSIFVHRSEVRTSVAEKIIKQLGSIETKE